MTLNRNNWRSGALPIALRIIREEGWKLRATHDSEDLIQIGYLTYRRVRSRHPERSGKHFGATFKFAFRNQIVDEVRKHAKHASVQVPDFEYQRLDPTDFEEVIDTLSDLTNSDIDALRSRIEARRINPTKLAELFRIYQENARSWIPA